MQSSARLADPTVTQLPKTRASAWESPGPFGMLQAFTSIFAFRRKGMLARTSEF